MRKKGFTLIELLAAIVIISVLMIIAIPALLNSGSSAKKKTFALYTDKIFLAAKDLEMANVYEYGFDSQIRVYDITTELGLIDTQDYEGYVVINNCTGETKYTTFLWNNEFNVMNFNLGSGDINDVVTSNSSESFTKFTSKEELIEHYNLDSCSGNYLYASTVTLSITDTFNCMNGVGEGGLYLHGLDGTIFELGTSENNLANDIINEFGITCDIPNAYFNVSMGSNGQKQGVPKGTGNYTILYRWHDENGTAKTQERSVIVTSQAYSISFDSQGGNPTPGNKTVEYQKAIGVLPRTYKAKYKLTGWFTSSSGGEQYLNNTIYNSQSNTTLYAHWENCPAGYLCSGSEEGDCPAGSYCPAGSQNPITCPAGSYCPSGSSNSITCEAGTYSEAGASTCSDCPVGSYCSGGNRTNDCPAGYYCPAKSIDPIKCPKNTYSNGKAGSCTPCATGYVSNAGSSSCTLNSYKLNLIKGTGISEIYYKLEGNSGYTKVTSSTSIDVKYNTKYYVYAVPDNGYSYNTYTLSSPLSGTMGTGGATYNPTGTLTGLSFTNQVITKQYSSSQQTFNIVPAIGGSGNYTYTEVSEKNSSNSSTSYFSISSGNVTISASTPINTYSYVIKVTDNSSNATVNATYTIQIVGATYTATFNIGSGVASIGASNASCNVVDSSNTCTITLPSITSLDGYESGKWATSSSAVGTLNPNSTTTLSGNQSFYAKATGSSYTCQPGYYFNGSSLTCHSCPAGSYCAGGTITYNGTNEGIVSCPNGYTSDSNTSNINNCYIEVPDGKGFDGSSITSCPAGTYASSKNVKYGETSSCTPCSAGTYSSTNASSCSSCPSGYTSGSGASSCTPAYQCSTGTLTQDLTRGASSGGFICIANNPQTSSTCSSCSHSEYGTDSSCGSYTTYSNWSCETTNNLYACTSSNSSTCSSCTSYTDCDLAYSDYGEWTTVQVDYNVQNCTESTSDTSKVECIPESTTYSDWSCSSESASYCSETSNDTLEVTCTPVNTVQRRTCTRSINRTCSSGDVYWNSSSNSGYCYSVVGLTVKNVQPSLNQPASCGYGSSTGCFCRETIGSNGVKGWDVAITCAGAYDYVNSDCSACIKILSNPVNVSYTSWNCGSYTNVSSCTPSTGDTSKTECSNSSSYSKKTCTRKANSTTYTKKVYTRSLIQKYTRTSCTRNSYNNYYSCYYSTYGPSCSDCGSTITGYYCPYGWSTYSGSNSDLKCYTSASRK